jgi:hypothetical protein
MKKRKSTLRKDGKKYWSDHLICQTFKAYLYVSTRNAPRIAQEINSYTSLLLRPRGIEQLSCDGYLQV